MSNLILPVPMEEIQRESNKTPENPAWAKRKTFVVKSYWTHELEGHLRKDIEDAGGIVCGVVPVPKYNWKGQINGMGTAIVYQHTEELNFWLWC